MGNRYKSPQGLGRLSGPRYITHTSTNATAIRRAGMAAGRTRQTASSPESMKEKSEIERERSRRRDASRSALLHR